MKSNYIPFSTQFRECSENGMIELGPIQLFEEHLELLPFCPSTAKKFLASPEKGIRLYNCLKFGGLCSSGNTDCRKMRGIN